jgi:hypothetical protein
MEYEAAYRADGSLAFWGEKGAYTAQTGETFIAIDEDQFNALNATHHTGAVAKGKLVLTETVVPADA